MDHPCRRAVTAPRPRTCGSSIGYLRNDLIHAEPVTAVTHSSIEDIPVTEQDWEKKLKGRFDENRFMGPGNAFFPSRMLSAGCARWAFDACVAFADEFYSRLGIKPSYDHVRDRFQPEVTPDSPE